MIFKTYQIYLSKIFTTTLLKTFVVFLSLAFILNIFEEINRYSVIQFFAIRIDRGDTQCETIFI